MYLEDKPAISYITITSPEGAFIDILDDFPNVLQDNLQEVEIEVTDIFPTSISINIEGYRDEIIEAIGHITTLLINYNIFSFHFTLHTLEQLKD